MDMLINFAAVWLLNAVGVYVTASVVPGMRVRNFGAAAMAALVLGVIHAVLWKVLLILTLPLTILTFGLFYFVLVGFTFSLASAFVDGFEVKGIFAGLLGSVVLGLVNAFIGFFAHGHFSWW